MPKTTTIRLFLALVGKYSKQITMKIFICNKKRECEKKLGWPLRQMQHLWSVMVKNGDESDITHDLCRFTSFIVNIYEKMLQGMLCTIVSSQNSK